MRVTLNRRTDTLYISFTDFDDADAVRQYMLVEHDIRGALQFDFDKKGVLLGIEIKFASSAVPQAFLDEAELV